MNDTPDRQEGAEPDIRPTTVARRAVLRRGAKLAYIIPAVLGAVYATPARASVSGGGGCLPGVLKLELSGVPAELLAMIAAAEQGLAAA